MLHYCSIADRMPAKRVSPGVGAPLDMTASVLQHFNRWRIPGWEKNEPE
jgi:hypothetical protein